MPRAIPAAATAVRRAYTLMRRRHGHLGWWPGDTPLEICLGAILTQNTSWVNVERALANLRQSRSLDARQLLALPERELADLIRPAGYFNVKARRLRAFLGELVVRFHGELSRMMSGDTTTVRQRLLAIHGIGPETADCLLLYVGGHASFVIDAYTRRIFARHGWSQTDATYDQLKELCEISLDQKPRTHRLDYWQDYHAQLVQVGKDYCRPRDPRCAQCPLRCLLPKPTKTAKKPAP